MELPQLFLENMKTLLGDDYKLYEESLSEDVRRGVRFNPLKASGEETEHIAKLLGSTGHIPWCKRGRYISKDVRAALLPWYAAGLYYIQEPSAMAPAEILSGFEGDYVLDLCAAPGGKATRLGTDAAFLLANDISASRARALVKNIELFGLENTAVTAETPERLSEQYPGFFDRILVDAPCSGEGMFKKDPALIASWMEKGPEHYHELQKQIMGCACEMLRPGGYLLYSPCTFSEIENEGTILHILESRDDMELMDIPGAKEYGFFPGKRGLDKACRLYPFAVPGEGHFLALLKKKGDGCVKRPGGIRQLENGGKLYRVFDDENVFKKGLRYLKRGVCLGEYNRAGKFRPSQAFALSLRRDELSGGSVRVGDFCAKVLDFEEEDPRVARYLKGETIEGDINGNVLICLDGHPLGFGRGNGGRIKNDLPVGYIRG